MTDTADGATAARALPRRRFFNDMPDKGLFAFVAVVGFLIIIWLKVKADNPELVAVLAVTLMVVYGVIAYNIPAVRLRLDRLGDNFYYLGFIYTLASMAAALMQLRRSGIEIEPILGSFGIALMTTIVGVAGRVMFVQMRGEIDEVEEQTRRDLLEASRELRAQLAQTLREFETFSTAVRQTAEETAKQSEAAAQKQIDLVASASHTAATEIRTVAQTAANEIRSAFEGNRSSARELAETIQRVAKAVDQTNTHFAGLELPTKRFEKELESFGTELVSLLKRLAAAVETGRALQATRRRWYWPLKRRDSSLRTPGKRWYWPFAR